MTTLTGSVLLNDTEVNRLAEVFVANFRAIGQFCFLRSQSVATVESGELLVENHPLPDTPKYL